jgi:RHS repeat-associated protein
MVQYIVADHLGTTSLVLDAQGVKVAESRHLPYGGERWRWPEDSTFPIDYRFTGQRLDSYIKLYQMGARWYDSELGRWISPDTIIPDPANPQSFNRLSYVRNNPLKLVDPSGFCEGTAEDHPESENACWNWIAEIEASYSNIWVDPALWTAEELALVYGALGMHIFKEEILSAERINLLRREGGKLGPAGTHMFADGTHTITIFNRAYYPTPDVNRWEHEPSGVNFQGTVIHEFTHIATTENPQINESYRDAQPFLGSNRVGSEYGIARCGMNLNCRHSEKIAMITSAYQLTPDVFRGNWQLDWIRQFNRPPGPGEVSMSAASPYSPYLPIIMR